MFVDANGLQIDGTTDTVLKVEDFEEKFRAFGFATQRINGHDHQAIENAIKGITKGVPNCIVLNTIKGKGVSFYEAMGVGVHSTNCTDEQYQMAIAELD